MVKTNSNVEKHDILDDIFTQEWYENVIKAANYASEHYDGSDLEKIGVAYDVVSYNIEKVLQESVLNTLVDSLPKSFDWSHGDVIQAFNEFKDIIDSCNTCPKFTKYSCKVFLGTSNVLKNQFLLWKELVNDEYPKLFLKVSNLKKENNYRIDISLKN